MNAFYDEMADLASELILEFGRPAILKQAATPTGPGYNQTLGVPVPFDVVVVDTNILNKAERGSLVERHTRVLYLTGAGVSPREQDEIIMDGKTFAIRAVLTHSPGGVPVLYEIEVSR